MTVKHRKHLLAVSFALLLLAAFAPHVEAATLNGNILSGSGGYGNNPGDYDPIVADSFPSSNYLDIKPAADGIDIYSVINIGTSKYGVIYGDDGANNQGGEVTFHSDASMYQLLMRDNYNSVLNLVSGVTLTTSSDAQIGYNGTGSTTATLNVTEATVKTGLFTVGVNANNSGVVNFTGSTLTTGELRIGATGNGKATFDDSTISSSSFIVGYAGGGTGIAKLTDTDITANGYFIVGRNGKGELDMTGGSITIATTNQFIVGDNTTTGDGTVTLTNVLVTTNADFLLAKGGANGKVTMNADSLTSGTIKAVNFYIGGGSGSVGELYLNGGSITATGQFHVGNNSSGKLVMTGGSIESTGTFYPGFHSHGEIIQSGGTITAKGATYFADQDYETSGNASTPVITSTYTMSNDSKFIATGGDTAIGQHGRGILTLEGGLVDATGRTINLGNQSKISSYGTLNISQSTAYTSEVKAAAINVGNQALALGDVNISGGTLALTGAFTVGNNATGRVENGDFLYGGTVNQSGGTVTAASVTVGNAAGSTGLYTISGADSSLTTTGNITIGNNATGRTENGEFIYGGQITQTDGYVKVGGILYAGAPHNGGSAAATGLYEVLGGTLEVHEYIIGGRGTGTMVIDGDAKVTGGANDFRIARGDNSASVGTLYMKDGELSLSRDLIVANHNGAKGYVYQTGGDVDVTRILSVGGAFDSNGNASTYGEYSITDGTASANEIIVGGRGKGVMTIDGGDVTSRANSFHLGRGNDSGVGTDGKLYMKSGSLTVLGDGKGLYIASRGHATGTLEMTGGTITTPTLSLGSEGIGTLTVSGGIIDAASFIIDNSNKGSTFNLIGAKSEWDVDSITSTAAANINLLLDSGGLSTLNVAGDAAINGNLHIGLASGAAIIQSDTLTFVSSTGGTVSGTRNYSQATTDIFTETSGNGSANLSFALNDATPSLLFGFGETVSFDTSQVSGWLDLTQDPAGSDLNTLRLTLLDNLYGNDGNTADADALLDYLVDSLGEFGYSVADATPAGSDGTYYFDIDLPDGLLTGGAAMFGWDFGAFNTAYGAGVGLSGATSVPEPATWAMMLAGLLGLLCFRRRSR